MPAEKVEILTDNGTTVKAIAPVIISASRSTDIPAYFPKWFATRFNGGRGYVKWFNPFNQKPVFVSFEKTKVIVFWTKNPKPLIPYLPQLDAAGVHYYFHFTGRGYLERFLKDMPFIINNAKAILTVSEYSKKDILRFFPSIKEEKIFVTPLAANLNYKPLNKTSCKDYIKNKYNIYSPFLLYIGGFSTRKNVREIILSFKKIYKSLNKDYKLVLCGSVRDEGAKLQELCKELFIDDKIIFTGFIPDDDLPYFYNASELFIYPSLYEGFGLPPLEAMSCATPVIASNLTSIPEVTENNAVLINPNNTDELASAILYLLNSPDLLLKYGQMGYKHSLNFNWQNTATSTLKAYESILI